LSSLAVSAAAAISADWHDWFTGHQPEQGQSMRLSVIIANWNYRDFVGDAITSALTVDWDDKEVIVVDDASTDDSRSVIESFGGKVAAYFRPKSNDLGAHMFGFD